MVLLAYRQVPLHAVVQAEVTSNMHSWQPAASCQIHDKGTVVANPEFGCWLTTESGL
jgi:hypothetical protein